MFILYTARRVASDITSWNNSFAWKPSNWVYLAAAAAISPRNWLQTTNCEIRDILQDSARKKNHSKQGEMGLNKTKPQLAETHIVKDF